MQPLLWPSRKTQERFLLALLLAEAGVPFLFPVLGLGVLFFFGAVFAWDLARIKFVLPIQCTWQQTHGLDSIHASLAPSLH